MIKDPSWISESGLGFRVSIIPSTVLMCPQKWPLPHKTFFSGDVCPGFQTSVDPRLPAWSPAHIGFSRFTSGATPANLLKASITAKPFWSTTFSSIGGTQTHTTLCGKLKISGSIKSGTLPNSTSAESSKHYRFGLLRTTIIHCMIKKTRISLKEFTEMVGSGRRVYILNSYLLSQKAKKTEQIIFVHCWLSL